MKAPDAFIAATEAHRRGDLSAAATGYRRVLEREPRHAEALFWLGTILGQQGNAAQGVPLLEQALSLKPTIPGGHHHLGNVYRQMKRPDKAVDNLRRAAAAEPKNPEVLSNLAGVLVQLGAHAEAEEQLKRALSIDPNYKPALVNFGSLCEITGRHAETLGYYERARGTNADDPNARFHRALALLTRGRLAEGWTEYQGRFAVMPAPAWYGKFPFPLWQGESLAGRHILVWSEQGLGDEILASSMIPDLARMAGAVTLLCAPRLSGLFSRSFPGVRVIAAAGKLAASVFAGIDFQASVAELGRWLRPSLEAFPQPHAFLRAAPDRTAALRTKYRALFGAKILAGISWRSRNPDTEAEKSTSLSEWAEILGTSDAAFISLQYGEVTEAERASGIYFDAEIDATNDLDGLAAQISALDLVISVTNTTVHLAGALGQEVWTLIPSGRGRLWYWFLDRSDSPWYPRVRLFRKTAGSWSSAISEIATALRQRPAAVSTEKLRLD